MLTNEQFTSKIKKLKEKQYLHEELASKYRREIERLTDERNVSLASGFEGKYIIYDGYYMRIDSYKKNKYGVYMYGAGYKPYQNGISYVNSLICSWRFMGDAIEITKEEYVSKFNQTMTGLQEHFRTITGE